MTIRRLRPLIALLGLLFAAPLHAEVVVLIHGYVSEERTWSESGITAQLEQAGWRYGGHFAATPRGNRSEWIPAGETTRIYATADLPSEAPLTLQAHLLDAMMQEIAQRFPKEPVVLVGHSAGGVVARMWMVSHTTPAVAGLVAIGSPNLGTDKAELALAIGSTPLSMLAPMIGADTLNRSQSLYADLVRERPGTLLYRLNRHPHPKAHYAAIVRQKGFSLTGEGDATVPTWSQDLNQVAALRGQAEVVTVAAGHGLVAEDGRALVTLLNAWHPRPPTP